MERGGTARASSWAGARLGRLPERREVHGWATVFSLVTVAQERRGGPLVAGLRRRGRKIARPLGLRGWLGQKREEGRIEFSFHFFPNLPPILFSKPNSNMTKVKFK